MPQSIAPRSSGRLARPGHLVAALVAASMLGLGGLTNGCGMIQFYRQSTHPSLPGDTKMDPELRARVEAVHNARIDAWQKYSGRMVPLATANVLLSFLLIVASASALAGRARAHTLALQAVAANIAYTIVDFVLERPLRAVVIEAATRGPPLSPQMPEPPPASLGWWFYRGLFCLQLIMFGLIAWSLTRPRVVALFGGDQHADQDV